MPVMNRRRYNTPKRTKSPTITQNRRFKHFRSEIYNYAFDLRSGHFHRWGQSGSQNVPWSPYGPEVLNVEISAGDGCPMTCASCYKKNKLGNTPRNMSFATFKSIFDKLPCVIGKTSGNPIYFVTQINFEITSINAHPEIWDIFDYCREFGVIPNVTINGADKMDRETMMRVVDTCGIINISINRSNFQNALDEIEKMGAYGAGRMNINYILNVQSFDFLYDDLLPAIKHDKRLRCLHEIVFLGLKPVNRGASFDALPPGEYIRLLNYCVKKNIPFAHDTCSSSLFEHAINFLDLFPSEKKRLIERAQRCEAGLFSGYIDVDGKWWHCSFGQGMDTAKGYVDVTKIADFHNEVWMNPAIKTWRGKVIGNKRECTLFPELRTDSTNRYKIT